MLLNFYVSVCPREITLDQHFIWFASIDNGIKSEFLFSWQSWQMRSLCAILSSRQFKTKCKWWGIEDGPSSSYSNDAQLHTTNQKERLKWNIWRMYDKNVTNFCLLCNAIPTWIVNGITVWNTKNVSNVLKTLKVRLFEVFSNTMKKLRITWDKEFYYAYFSKSCIWMQLLIVAKISFFANSAAARSTYLWKSNCRPKISGMIFLREKYLCGLKFRGCKELFADGIDILLQNGAWVVRWTAVVANWAWPVVLGIIPEQFCIKPQSVKEGWMALVQWTSRELLCTRAMY